MNRILRTLKGYIWWTYDRGSLHYDVMVTAILLFLFLSPRFINYKDKPTESVLTPKWVIVLPDGHGGMILEVDATAVKPGDDLDAQLLRIIEPITGEVKIAGYETVKTAAGKPAKYRVQVQR